MSHVNDPVLGLGSQYFPKGTKIYKHGDKNEYKVISHAKGPDCREQAPELKYMRHDNKKNDKSYLWKFLKPFLFIATLILFIIALPVRFIIKIVEKLNTSNLNDIAKTDNFTPKSVDEYYVDNGDESTPALLL